MLYMHTHIASQPAKPLSNELSQLLTFVLMVSMMVAGLALIVMGAAWVVAHVDDLLSFRTFKVFFVGNMVVWAAILGGLAVNTINKKRHAVAPTVNAD